MGGMFHLVRRNLTRKKLRTLFTLASVVIAFVLFALLGGLSRAFTAGAGAAGAIDGREFVAELAGAVEREVEIAQVREDGREPDGGAAGAEAMEDRAVERERVEEDDVGVCVERGFGGFVFCPREREAEASVPEQRRDAVVSDDDDACVQRVACGEGDGAASHDVAQSVGGGASAEEDGARAWGAHLTASGVQGS